MGRSRSAVGRRSAERATLRRGGASRSRASARRRTSRSRRPITVRLDVDDEQRLLEPGRARHDLALVVDDEEWPSKTSSSCPPTALQNATKHDVVARTRANISSRSRSLPTWKGDAEMFDEQLRAGEREIGGRRPRLPYVLADGEPTRVRRARPGAGRGPARSSGPRRTRRSSAGSACGRRPSPRRRSDGAARCRGRCRSAGRRREGRAARLARDLLEGCARPLARIPDEAAGPQAGSR